MASAGSKDAKRIYHSLKQQLGYELDRNILRSWDNSKDGCLSLQEFEEGYTQNGAILNEEEKAILRNSVHGGFMHVDGVAAQTCDRKIQQVFLLYSRTP